MDIQPVHGLCPACGKPNPVKEGCMTEQCESFKKRHHKEKPKTKGK